jgi:hypothetical protein
MNLLIIGHRQHGKSDVGELLAKALNTVAHDSSWFACERVVYPALKEQYGYTSPKEAYDDRMNHRQEWFELIEAYNHVPDRLTRAILTEGKIYVGMRSRKEFEGSKHHFDHVIWVDASRRVSDEESTSMKLNRNDADYVLDNNGPLTALPDQITNLLRWLADRIPKDEESLLVYGIDPRHHLGRGTLSEYVLEQLLSGNHDELEKHLGDLHGQGTDKPMSPMRLRESLSTLEENDMGILDTNHFEGSMVMGNYDQVSLVTNNEDGVSITAVDPSIYETSFNNLQVRIGEWADETLSKETDGPKFDLIVDQLRALVEDLHCPEDWAEALLLLMQGMNEAGLKMHEDIMPAAYRQLQIMKDRTYYTNDHGDLQWISK